MNFDDDILFRPESPRTLFYKIQADPTCPDPIEMNLSAAHLLTFQFLLMKLMYVAGDIEPIDSTEIRAIELGKTVVLADCYLAPLCVYFRISGDVAYILYAEPIPAAGVVEILDSDLSVTMQNELKKVMAEKSA